MRFTAVYALTALVLCAPLSAQEQQQADHSTQTVVAAQATATGAQDGSAASRLAATPATMESAAARLAGSTIESQRAGVAHAVAPVVMVRRARTTRSTALMIVGGVGILVGAAIGGDGGNILMLGSGVIGLYGLYLYLQ